MEERTQQGLVLACVAERSGNALAEMKGIVGDEISQVGGFGVAPDVFGGIEFRSISRQPLDADPSAKAGLELAGRRPRDLPAIPDQRDFPEPTDQLGHELNHILGNDVVIEDVEVESQASALGRNRKGGDHRQPIMPVPAVKHGGFTPRRPGATDHRLQQEAGFIKKNKRSAAAPRVFLCAAHRSCASDRWPPGRVREHAAEASGNSSRADATSVRRPTGRTRRRTCEQSTRRCAARSTTPWSSPAGADPASRARSASGIVGEKVSVGAPDAPGPRAHRSLPGHALVSIGILPTYLRPTSGRLPSGCTLPPTTRSLASVSLGVVPQILCDSCIAISQIPEH